MKVLAIQSNNYVVNRKKHCAAKNPLQTNFRGNYKAVYSSALQKNIKNYEDAKVLFQELLNAAHSEDGLFKGIYYYLLKSKTSSLFM